MPGPIEQVRPRRTPEPAELMGLPERLVAPERLPGMSAERVLRWVLLGGLVAGCVYILYPFFSAVLWAAILAFSTWPVFEWLRTRLRLPRAAAALAMVVLTAVLIVLPLAAAVPGSAEDVTRLRRALDSFFLGGLPPAPLWLSDIPLIGPAFAGYWNGWSADLSAMGSFFKPYLGIIAEESFRLVLGIAGGVLQFVLALFIGFFFWLSGDSLARHLQAIMRRIAGEQADRLIAVTGSTVRGTVYGILGTALVQGVLTAFGLWLSGVPRAVLLGAIAGLIAVLPVGAPVVWIPCSIWLMFSGHVGWGIFLAAYGTVVISGADHLIRPYFIARGAKMPFLLTVLGVLGGALGFGLLGVFLGPVLLGVGFTLLIEFARNGENRLAPSPWQ